MSIGERIAQLRKQHGMTQEQLADQLGTTRQAVSKWEAGKSNPDIDYVIAMSVFFAVSTDFLLLGISCKQEETSVSLSDTAHAPKKKIQINRNLFIIALVFGICLLLLLPLFATLYRNYTFNTYGSAYTDARQYLSEWPLKGIVVLGIGALLIGIGGVIEAYFRRKK